MRIDAIWHSQWQRACTIMPFRRRPELLATEINAKIRTWHMHVKYKVFLVSFIQPGAIKTLQASY